MVFSLPADVDQRPVVIDGAGTLGRQIASVYAAGGSDVRIFDLSEEQRQPATTSKSTSPRPSRRSGYTPPGAGESKSPMTCRRPSPAHGW